MWFDDAIVRDGNLARECCCEGNAGNVEKMIGKAGGSQWQAARFGAASPPCVCCHPSHLLHSVGGWWQGRAVDIEVEVPQVPFQGLCLVTYMDMLALMTW